MSRPREFDTEVALTQIMETFWSQGFLATSLEDLTQATGVAKASLYGAFGDKQAMFLAALDAYAAETSKPFQEILTRDDSPRLILNDFFEEILAQCHGEEAEKGCFFVNSSVERAARDQKVVKLIQHHTEGLESAFDEVLKRGVRLGEFKKGLKTQEVARFLVSSLIGLHVTGIIYQDKIRPKQVIQVILSVLSAGED